MRERSSARIAVMVMGARRNRGHVRAIEVHGGGCGCDDVAFASRRAPALGQTGDLFVTVRARVSVRASQVQDKGSSIGLSSGTSRVVGLVRLRRLCSLGNGETIRSATDGGAQGQTPGDELVDEGSRDGLLVFRRESGDGPRRVEMACPVHIKERKSQSWRRAGERRQSRELQGTAQLQGLTEGDKLGGLASARAGQ